MKLNIRGDKIKVTEAIKEYAIEKLGKVDKLIDNSESVEAQILVKIEKVGQKVEATIPIKGIILRAEEVQEDIYAAIDVVVDKLERQLRKNKTRIKEHLRKNKKDDQYNFYADSFLDKEEKEENKSGIVKRKEIVTEPMVDEEAIIQMEMLDHSFFIYKDAKTMEHKIIYKRKDGNYGTIDIK